MQANQDLIIEKLHREYFAKMLIYATNILGDRDRAQDVVQDTFHEAIIHITEIENHTNPGGWLMQTLKNKIRDSERARLRFIKHFLSLDSDVNINLLIDNNSFTQTSAGEENCSYIIEKIEKALTSEEFKLLKRLTLDKASHLQVSSEFNISVYACQKRLERIRKKLLRKFPEWKK